MKNKYQRLTKEEQKKAREKYFSTETGKNAKMRFNRLLIISIILALYSCFLIIDAVINDASIWSYISAIFTFIFAIIFFVGRHKIIIRDVNNYLIKKK